MQVQPPGHPDRPREEFERWWRIAADDGSTLAYAPHWTALCDLRTFDLEGTLAELRRRDPELMAVAPGNVREALEHVLAVLKDEALATGKGA